MNNTNFNSALEQSGKSMYAVSKRSGVPYTTINEIHNGKKDINQCAAGTVYRIAAALDVPADTILNEIHYLDGVKGKYKGIDYIWSTGDSSQITFEFEGKNVILSVGKIYNIPSRIEYYQVIAGWMIKEYIAKAEWKKENLARIERIRRDE
ncbi:MAG: helix-turn-helix transcriptional regulator [Firmicutes bacterium]|nr:helix-turn-helix transcriptional regulator [Bacillota bacterium]